MRAPNSRDKSALRLRLPDQVDVIEIHGLPVSRMLKYARQISDEVKQCYTAHRHAEKNQSGMFSKAQSCTPERGAHIHQIRRKSPSRAPASSDVSPVPPKEL